jgi:hypothetical protein
MGLRSMTTEGRAMDKSRLVSALTDIRRIAAEALRDVDTIPALARPARRPATQLQNEPAEISFGMNVLAFVKKYCVGLSGDRKFAALLAYLAKGETSKQVSLSDMKGHWNRMKSVMGGKFNPAYANRAKANGWIDTSVHGSYNLSSDWKRALGR